MNDVTFTLDGREITAAPGATILAAADAAGVYIPRLCHRNGLTPHGGCRICTVLVNGRPQAACTQPVAPGAVVEHDTERVNNLRRAVLEMIFVEGNHYCMFCEKSGDCELQALAYRLGITAPRYPHLFPRREIDLSHPDVFIDRNRCVLCGRCVRTSRDVDGKHVFDFIGRGPHRRIGVDAPNSLSETPLAQTDAAAAACPVGAIVKKRSGYRVPIGQRRFDHQPIGSEIEKKAAAPQTSA